MITTYNCERCGLTTIFDKKQHVMVDKERDEENIQNIKTYKNHMNRYEKRVESITKDFKETIEKHNAEVRWYNFKTEWFLDVRDDVYTSLRIREKNTLSFEHIEKIEIITPHLNLSKYLYTVCPICNYRKYFE